MILKLWKCVLPLLLLVEKLITCTTMTTSKTLNSDRSMIEQTCGDNVLPGPMTCEAAYLPPSESNMDNQLEVELTCSWNHAYPVEGKVFIHGFDAIRPDIDLRDNMIIIARHHFDSNESGLAVIEFSCSVSYLHPLCGQQVQTEPCAITRASLRVDPLVQEAVTGGSVNVACRGRDTNITSGTNMMWTAQTMNQDEFRPIRNGSRRHILNTGALLLTNIKLRDDLLMLRCDADGKDSTKNYGVSQLRVVRRDTTVASSATSTTSAVTSVPVTTLTSTFKQVSVDVTTKSRSTVTPTSMIVPRKPTPWQLFFENVYIAVPITLIPSVLFVVICVMIAIIRCRLKRKVSDVEPDLDSRPDSRTADNDYEYNHDDDAIEHEYFNGCVCNDLDTKSERSIYANESVFMAKKSRAARLLRSKSDSRLAMAARMDEDILMQNLSHSQSAWALPGMSHSYVVDKPMPKMPSKKPSLTRPVTTYEFSDCALSQGSNKASTTSPEYAYADSRTLSRSFDKSKTTETQPYAWTVLHPRSQTMDPKLFTPKRIHKK